MNIFKIFKKEKKPVIGFQDLIDQGIFTREEILFIKKKRAFEEYDREISGEAKNGRVKIKIGPKWKITGPRIH